MASVDVVVPCYKYAHYLPFCVNSILTQRGVDVRVLILDDVSPDNTPEVGKALAAADPRVEYRRNEKNLGLIGTANIGVIGWAKADYVVLLSADDALTPGSLARAVQVFDANPDVGLIFGRCALMAESNPTETPPDAQTATYQVWESKRLLEHFYKVGNPTPSPSVIARTKLHHELGGYNPKLPHTSDMEMWMRFATRGSVGVIRDEQAFYRLHASNMSGAFNNQALRDRQELLDACEEIAANWCKHIPEAQVWLKETQLRMAEEAFWLAGRALEANDSERLGPRLAFAEKYHPSPWTSRIALRFYLKRLLGRSISSALKRKPAAAPDATDTPDSQADGEAANYRRQRGTVGWWPETSPKTA
jgi:glycosyltransferase involved in cell wall biosynthesis